MAKKKMTVQDVLSALKESKIEVSRVTLDRPIPRGPCVRVLVVMADGHRFTKDFADGCLPQTAMQRKGLFRGLANYARRAQTCG